MTILAVDLAARFSAAAVVAEDGRVDWEENSMGQSSLDWVRLIGHTASAADELDYILVEDVPYGISNQSMVKPVLRLQGMLIHELSEWNLLEQTLFVNPATWQRHYPGVARAPKGLSTNESKKYREDAARVAALELGYEPPRLAEHWAQECEKQGKRALKSHLKEFAKQETDHIDAYLMARWAYTFEPVKGIRAVSGVQEVFA